MWDSGTRHGLRRVATGLPFGHVAGLVGDERRARIGVTGLDTDHAVHAPMLDIKRRRHSRPKRRPGWCVVVYFRRNESPPNRHAIGGPAGRVDVASADWTAL